MLLTQEDDAILTRYFGKGPLYELVKFERLIALSDHTAPAFSLDYHRPLREKIEGAMVRLEGERTSGFVLRHSFPWLDSETLTRAVWRSIWSDLNQERDPHQISLVFGLGFKWGELMREDQSLALPPEWVHPWDRPRLIRLPKKSFNS